MLTQTNKPGALLRRWLQYAFGILSGYRNSVFPPPLHHIHMAPLLLNSKTRKGTQL